MMIHVISFSRQLWETTLILLATTLVLPAVLFLTIHRRSEKIMRLVHRPYYRIYFYAWLYAFSWWFSSCLVDKIGPRLYPSVLGSVGAGTISVVIFQIYGDLVFILLVYVLSNE